MNAITRDLVHERANYEADEWMTGARRGIHWAHEAKYSELVNLAQTEPPPEDCRSLFLATRNWDDPDIVYGCGDEECREWIERTFRCSAGKLPTASFIRGFVHEAKQEFALLKDLPPPDTEKHDPDW